MTRRRRQFLNAAENLRQPDDLDNVAHFEPRRETVGDLLRRAREGKRLEIATVSGQLRIRAGYLKAIEEGRFQDLPGLTYAVGFVRTYADHLGLDSEDVVRRFRDEVAELKSQTQLIFPVVAAEGKIPRGAVLLLSAVLAAIAYGGWYYLSEREESALDLIPTLPAKLQELISGESAPVPDPASEALPGSTGEVVPGTTAPPPPTPLPTTAPVPGTSVDPAPVSPPPAAQAPAVQTPPADTSSPDTPAAPPPVDDAATGSAVPAIPGVASSPAPAPATPPVEAGTVAPAPAAPAADAAESAAVSALSGVPQDAAPAPAAPAPADPAPPSVAAPTLDASGLPTVAAPAAPPATTIPGISAPSDATVLPPVADGQVFGATDGNVRIVLVARLESWIQVTDPETNALMTRVLRAGDRYYVPEQAGLSLATGNAGGLDIWVDGRKTPALGPVGVVRRGVALDAARLQSGTALPQ